MPCVGSLMTWAAPSRRCHTEPSVGDLRSAISSRTRVLVFSVSASLSRMQNLRSRNLELQSSCNARDTEGLAWTAILPRSGACHSPGARPCSNGRTGGMGLQAKSEEYLVRIQEPLCRAPKQKKSPLRQSTQLTSAFGSMRFLSKVYRTKLHSLHHQMSLVGVGGGRKTRSRNITKHQGRTPCSRAKRSSSVVGCSSGRVCPLDCPCCCGSSRKMASEGGSISTFLREKLALAQGEREALSVSGPPWAAPSFSVWCGTWRQRGGGGLHPLPVGGFWPDVLLRLPAPWSPPETYTARRASPPSPDISVGPRCRQGQDRGKGQACAKAANEVR